MAHDVRVKIDTAVARHKDFEVTVKNGEGKVGTLLISKGNIEWVPKGYSVNKRRLTWGKFGELMKEHGTPVRKSKNGS